MYIVLCAEHVGDAAKVRPRRGSNGYTLHEYRRAPPWGPTVSAELGPDTRRRAYATPEKMLSFLRLFGRIADLRNRCLRAAHAVLRWLAGCQSCVGERDRQKPAESAVGLISSLRVNAMVDDTPQLERRIGRRRGAA